jgi:CspA family cold shock protein
MSNSHRAVVCQLCGAGFMVTPNYQDFLARHGARVVVPVLCPRCFSQRGPLPKQQGKVKWFNQRRRYGFIVTQEGQEVFFHRDQVLGESSSGPHEGQQAQFHLRYAIKGPEALNVELGGA